MREIKFRAWVVAQKKMYYGVEAAYDTLGFMKDSKGEDIDYYWDSFLHVLAESEKGVLHLMQYTGLKDKNGKEIYDGDILSSDDQLWEIDFGKNDMDNTIAAWTMRPLEIQMVYPIDMCISKLEIIGNIYENPELLK